jgi:HEAT repeat protein
VPADWHCQPEEIASLCAQALERVPEGPLLECFKAALERGATFQEHIVQVRVLGARGAAGGLEILLRNATELGDLELGRPSVRATLRTAFSSTLRRDPRAWAPLEEVLLKDTSALDAVLVEALGECAEARGMSLLERLFERGRLAREELAQAMAMLEEARPFDLGGRTLAACARFWMSAQAGQRALVATLAGRVHALESIPQLIEFLSEEEGVVVRSAEQALTRLAGLPAASTSAEWTAWFEREQAWHRERFAPLCAELVGTQASKALEAMRELSAHPLFRHQSARALAEGLAHMKRAAAVAACRELERIGSRWALPALVAVLSSGPPALQNSAAAVTRALAGDAPVHDLARWRAWIGA